MNDKTEYSKVDYGIGFVVTAVLFAIALFYGANLQLRQSVIVAMILAWIATYAEGFKRDLETRIKNSLQKPVYKFLPYFVRIDPKWESILLDFHLIGSLAGWELIKEEVWKALPLGFAFTVLRESPEFNEKLIFRANGHANSFASEADFSEEIEVIKFTENRFFRLRVFARWAASGYELGITVPDKWWERIKADCPHPVRESSGNEFCEIELILGIIPDAEFASYLEPAEDRIVHPKPFKATQQRYDYEGRRKRMATSQQEGRTKEGWSESELYKGGPKIIENSYFTVRHELI